MTTELRPNRFCSQCGTEAPESELAKFGEFAVCANCKDSYAQKLREGINPVATHAFAGFWQRVAAACIDFVILFLLQFVLGMVFGTVLVTRDPSELMRNTIIMNLFGFAIGTAYEGILISRHGATPGKMALGLEVVRPGGGPISLGRAIGRYYSKIISAMILFIGYIMIVFDSEKRALHDMMCDTRVVKTR